MESLPFLDCVYKRHCIRAFLNEPINRSSVESILLAAGQAASSKNSQPWFVCGVDGKRLAALSALLCKKFDAENYDDEEYTYMMDPIPSIFMQRARECGYGLFRLKGIDRKDYPARKEHHKMNYRFFNAPLSLFFFLPKEYSLFNKI